MLLHLQKENKVKNTEKNLIKFQYIAEEWLIYIKQKIKFMTT